MGSEVIPELEALGAELRAAWRAEETAAARDAYEGFRHARTLREVAADAMQRGDRVTVAVAGARFSGTIGAVGRDVLTLRTGGGRIDVHLAPSVPLALHVHGNGVAGISGGTSGSLRAALLGREGETVRVGSAAEPEAVRGRLSVGADHVGLGTDSGTTWVPLAALAWVAPAG